MVLENPTRQVTASNLKKKSNYMYHLLTYLFEMIL